MWRLEWRLALRRRRLLAMNVGIPLLLVIPLALGGAPPFHAAAAYAVLFVLVGTFGSAIPLIRDGEEGLLRRIVLDGAVPRSWLLERALAGTAIDVLALTPALGLILVAGGASGVHWLLALPVLAGSLLAANLIGVWVAMLSRSLAEGALFAAVVSLFLLHASGVFRTPAPGGLAATVEGVLPFAPLHALLLASASGGPLPDPVAGVLLTTFAPTIVLLLLTGTFSDRIAERIAMADHA